ncbi:MAG: CCA tRNA nucleotidyltransferase [Symploca sp. SIO2G7]|nr:CCA tRNA nucleotidyltransferase [Symploca sp. SIO2G7]
MLFVRYILSDILRRMYSTQAVDQDVLKSLETNVYERLQTSLQAYSMTLNAENLWTLLTYIAITAQQRGWHLYLVGGVVRDLLLTPEETLATLKDIDLVVDSFRTPVAEGAAVVLAQQVQLQYPEAELQIHDKFQTAALSWRSQLGSAPLTMDIATARTEFYPYPAANPEIEPGSIYQDLYRRDFTINAMAIRLTSPRSGLLLDFFSGYLDIQQRQIRVIHIDSFIEDPTRIFRAVRFAVRLGFAIDTQTEALIRYAVDSNIYTDMQQTQKRLPALQTRLKAELSYMLQTDYWAQSLELLNKLGALSCLHPSLLLNTKLWQQMYRVGQWRQRFIDAVGKDINVAPWLMRLEVLLAEVESCAQIASSLQLPLGSIRRLRQLDIVEDALLDIFTNTKQIKASLIYQTLATYELPLLLLLSVRHPQRIGTHVYYYISHLIHCRSPINGHYLKRLGYSPGPLYQKILTALNYAVLDGDVTSLASAEAYLKKHYPMENGHRSRNT